MSLRSLGWTDDFAKFRQKVEPFFGKLEELAVKEPDIYAHQVLSHGFMEYAGVRDIHGKIKLNVAGDETEFHKVVNGSDTPEKERLKKEYYKNLKTEYLFWARANNLPEDLLERGWQEYLED